MLACDAPARHGPLCSAQDVHGPHLANVQSLLSIGAHYRHRLLGRMGGRRQAIIEVVRRRVGGTLQLLGGIVTTLSNRIHAASELDTLLVLARSNSRGSMPIPRA